MISAPAELIALMDSGKFLMADLYDFITIAGTHYRYAGGDFDVAWNGNTYTSGGLRLERSRTRIVRGLEVDTMDLTVYPTNSDLIGGVPFLQALSTGALDGANMTLYRAFLPAVDQLAAGALWRFSGRISEAEMTRTEARIKVKSFLELLDIQMPRNLYQPGCIHTLFDTGCALNSAGFGVNNSVIAGSTRTQINNTLAQAAGYFDQGKIVFNTGANAGVMRTTKSHTSGVIKLALPLPYTPSAGDTFTAYPGCDKLQATCSGKFSNLPNFRAFPNIPVPEAAL